MDKGSLLREQLDDGERFIEALAKDGFEIQVAFWAKPTEDEKWYLYLASPMVDEQGPRAAYLVVQAFLRKSPDLPIDPFEVKVVGLKDSLTHAALAIIKPASPASPYAGRRPKRYPTWFGGSTLAGRSIDGAYIYPLPEPSKSA
jgi:hypothetical protein